MGELSPLSMYSVEKLRQESLLGVGSYYPRYAGSGQSLVKSKDSGIRTVVPLTV